VCADIFVAGRRQPMGIMTAVWPLTMLYRAPLGLIFYGWFRRTAGWEGRREGETPMWQATFKGATHCGTGCALGGEYLFESVMAYLFGIVFQYFSVAPMRGLGLRDGVIAAIKVDTLSLLAYEVGMFAWMAVRAWLWPRMEPTQWSYWLMMQIPTVLGFLMTYPVNWWLIRRGTKQMM
jgi:hypothetical protein